jgi:phosphopantothenoylcysteine decarboxylase/phosphopantothenate--cysteine ligase
MLAACEKEFDNTDIAVFSAAVADYTPENPATQKIKKSNEKMDLHLIKNPDIAKILGMKKKPNQISVGFALETENEIQHAVEKLDKKNLDLVVLNSVNDIGATFGHDTNKIYLIDRQRNIQEFPLKSKIEVAEDIVAKICSLVQSK